MKKAKLSLFLIFFSVALFSQQPKKLFTPSGTLYHSGTNNIGINEDKPKAALHIKESIDNSTALQIDLVNQLLPGNGANYTHPEFAFKINSYVSEQPGLAQLASIDAKGVMRLGYFGYGSENLRVNHSLGVYAGSSNNISLQYSGSGSFPELVWKTANNKNFRFKSATTSAIPLTLSPSGKVGINTEDFSGDHDLYVNGSVYLKGDSPETHTMYIEGSSIAEEFILSPKSE